MSRAYTKEEVRDQVLQRMRDYAKYWAAQPNMTELDRCNGLAFSLCNILDGTSGFLPSMDLVLQPHEEDKAFAQANNKNWYEPSMVVNDDCNLHELYFTEEMKFKG